MSVNDDYVEQTRNLLEELISDKSDELDIKADELNSAYEEAAKSGLLAISFRDEKNAPDYLQEAKSGAIIAKETASEKERLENEIKNLKKLADLSEEEFEEVAEEVWQIILK